MQKYYKVTNQSRCSARASLWPEKFYFSVKYEIGKFAYPTQRNSKLFVFDNLEAARSFANYSEKIFECEVINPVKAKYISGFFTNVERFWDLKSKKKSLKRVAEQAIEGTIFCDAVKLTREII